MISPYHPAAIFREEPWIPRRIPELSFALPPPHFCNTRSRDYRLNSASPAKLPSVVPTGARSSGKRSPAARPQATQPLSSLTRGLRAIAVLLLGCAALRHARPGRTAVTVLVLGLVLLGAAAAEAQTSRILVSNSVQTADDSANTSGNKHAQLFHTGANTAGYTLTGVIVASDDTLDDDFDVEVCEEDGTANEFPTTTCTALTAPDSFVGVGNVPFTHATGLALSANTNYVVVVTQRGTGSVELDSTTSSGEDSLGLSDWSIKNKFYWQSGGTWMLKSGSNEALRIIVNGYANTVNTTDATLSALSVSGATLSPAFAAATTSYQATVANSVNQGTITQTTSEPTATVEYLDSSDATLTDADTMTAGLQVNLSVGANIVKVKVTAPDTTTTKTYTVNVFRVGPLTACSTASMTNRIWTGTLTVGTRMLLGSTAYGWEVGGTYAGASLTDDSFTFESNTYDFDQFLNGLGSLSLGFTTINPGDIVTAATRNKLVLHVGDDAFPLKDGLFDGDRSITWSSNVPTWAKYDQVCLAITAVPPDISSVALTSAPGTDNTYAIGDSVAATVTFSEAVDITGSPQLELDFAGTAKAAGCATGTNTTTMVCEYEVVANDSAPDGVEIEANKLTGGTIYATGSTTINADLDHTAVAIDADHKVDGIRPTLVTTAPDAPTTSTDGTKVILTFSETLLSLVLRSNITIQANGVTVSTTAASVTGTTVELTLTTALTASATNITVELDAFSVQDAAGNANSSLAVTGVTNAVTPTPPGQPAAPSVSSVAGSTTSLSVTWTAPTNTGPAIDNYDLQYRQGTNGTFTDGPQNETGTSATITGLTANTLYQVQVRATNSDGNSPWSLSGSGQTNTAGNSAPTFANPTETRSVAENSPANTDVGAPVTATDGNNDQLTYTLEGGMDASSFSIVSTSGQIRTRSGVTYDYETKSSYTVIVKADDGNGGTDTVTVTITLTDDLNELPLAPAAPRVTATPNTTDSLTVSWSAPSNTGRPDISSYDLQYREGTSGSWNGPQNETGTTATITGLTAAPTAYQVQVRAINSDGAGPWSPPGRIRTTPPPPVNYPPRAVDDAAETPEDTPVTISVLGNDSDPDRNTLTVMEVSAPTHGTAVVADTGAVVYTPEPDFHGTDRFTYVVGDGSGLTARAAVTVTVLPVNDPPLAGDDAAETPEDTPVTISVLGNDSDGDGDTLTVVEASAPTHGTAVVADTGEVVYTPEPDFHGTDRFTYVVGDGSGLTARAAVDVTVRPVNDPPLAAGVIPDRTLDIGDEPAALDLIPFFADRDGDALDYTAVVSDQAVAVSLTGATLTLTATHPGTATVTVTAQDPGGLTATQAFMVTTTDHQEARNVKAWLARFGRTVANHAVEAVRGRMFSAPGPSRGVTLGGAELKEPPATEITQASPWDELTPEDQRPENFNSLRMREFLLSSSFEVSLAQNATQNPGPGWTAWGGAARTSFSGRDSEVSINGDVTTATLGVDRAWDRLITGVALARSTGEGSYSSGDTRGDLKSSITSAHPYLRFSLNDRLSAWTLLGYGKGELTLTHEGGGEKTDIEMKMAALGARGALVAAGGFDISVRSDALLVRTSSEKTSRMAETEADVSRLRLVLEGSRPFAFASRTSLTPSVEVGVRRDGGDAERGVGFEVGGAMRYANPSLGLTVEITARRLMAHEQSGYSEWGAGGSLQFAPGGAERGFSARLGSSVGTTASGVEGLWAMGDTRGLTGGAQAPGRLDAEAGYAMGAFGGSGIITPYGGFSMSGDRRYRAGWRLRLGDSFNLSLEGDRTENPDAPSRHAVALRGDLRW